MPPHSWLECSSPVFDLNTFQVTKTAIYFLQGTNIIRLPKSSKIPCEYLDPLKAFSGGVWTGSKHRSGQGIWKTRAYPIYTNWGKTKKNTSSKAPWSGKGHVSFGRVTLHFFPKILDSKAPKKS